MESDAYRIADCCRRNLVKYTIKAFSLIPEIDRPAILDMGCGTGEPALALLEACNGKVYAVDSDMACINSLKEKVNALSCAERIEIIHGSVFDQNLLKNKFDIVLAEGLLNVTGFETGLPLLINFLKPNGCMIIHDELLNDTEKRVLFGKYGLDLLNSFELTEKIWWNEYFSCLERLTDNADGNLFKREINEVNQFKKDPESCRSIYYIVKLTGRE